MTFIDGLEEVLLLLRTTLSLAVGLFLPFLSSGRVDTGHCKHQGSPDSGAVQNTLQPSLTSARGEEATTNSQTRC
jgi:hypothetical protein